jgi:hypothetical protein
MIHYGTWSPYSGNGALLLAVTLLVIAGFLVYLGTRLHRPIRVTRPGRTVGILLVMIWFLSLASFAVAAATYVSALYQQVGPVTLPTSPISPVTDLSILVAFIVIAYLSRHAGLITALGSAIIGTVAAPLIFELPFDLIVMGRTYPPTPALQYTLLFFLPLFILEIASFSLLTLSPLTRFSKLTLFSLAAMFFVFAIWALFGFSYPSSPFPFVLNAISKVLSFITAITLFLPHKE